jgi:transposase
MRAWDLSQSSWSQADIAEALGVTAGAVSQWLALARRSGRDALLHHPHPGPVGKLLPSQRRLIVDFLWHGAEAYGFRGAVWTCRRVAKVIKEELGVAYHPCHVSRILKELGWTPQVPITRAIQRDEEAIQRWREQVWPGLKRRARRERRSLVFVDESGFYLLPGVVKTYGCKGITPIVDEYKTHDHLSVMAGLTTTGQVYTLVRQQSLTGLEVIDFLTHLGNQLKGAALVIWDGSPIHRRVAVKEFIEAVGTRNLQVETLPPYAPDLNPAEWLWQHLKHVEMANLSCRDLEELHEEFHLALGRIRGKPRLFPSFFAGAQLPL